MGLGGAHVVLGLEVGAALQQHLHHLLLALLSSTYERRHAILQRGRSVSRGEHTSTHTKGREYKICTSSRIYVFLSDASWLLIHPYLGGRVRL